MPKFIKELMRRNVFRVAGAYAVIAWLLTQMATVLETSMNMPAWFDTMIVSCLMLGLPIALLFAWAFEMTPEGVKRTESVDPAESVAGKTGRVLDYVLIGGLLLVGGLIIADRMIPKSPSLAEQTSENVALDVNDIDGQSIAVLPFEDFSPEKDQAYFADGIAEELLNVLARVNGLRVASRTSAFSFKERDASIGEIAKALNVQHILEGSVRKAGNTLRITAQLINTTTDEHLWSETYDRPLTAENIFEIQDEISQAIVLELHGRMDLLPNDDDRPTNSAEAYEAYLKGKAAYAVRTPESIENSITEFIRAVTLDPDFAVAHSKLAFTYLLAGSYTDLPAKVANERGDIHIAKARLLSPEHWEVLSDYAWLLQERETVSDAEKLAAFDAATAANPNNSEAHRGKGVFLISLVRFSEGKKSLQKARALNPRSAVTLMGLANVAEFEGKMNEVIQLNREVLELEPGYSGAYNLLANAYFATGQANVAHRIWKQCDGLRGCDNGLSNFYASLNMIEATREISAIKADYYIALHERRHDDVVRLAAKLEKNEPISLFISYFLAERLDLANQVLEKNVQVFETFLDSEKSANLRFAILHLTLLAVFEHTGDLKKAETVRELLNRTFANIKPGKQSQPQIYLAGAHWRMINNDEDGAIAWLNVLADQDVPFALTKYWPTLEPLRKRADYQATEARIDANAAKLRNVIEAQLANPPEVWWSIDEASEATKKEPN